MIDGKVSNWYGICTGWNYTHLTKKEGDIPGHVRGYKAPTSMITSPKSGTVSVLTAADQIKQEDEKTLGKNVPPSTQNRILWAQAMMRGLDE
eukprot:11861334-Ditylum_brightwellii.AAC.1